MRDRALKGTYDDRVGEYRFAAFKAFKFGWFRKTTPVLEVGCSTDPYDGFLRFLRSYGWEETLAARGTRPYTDRPYGYLGLHWAFDPSALRQAYDDAATVTLMATDLDDFRFENPPGRDGVVTKRFGCAFLIESMAYVQDQEAVIDSIKSVAASIFVIGPNAGFRGWRKTDPDHINTLSVSKLLSWGFQVAHPCNFNGFDPDDHRRRYSVRKGPSSEKAEVYGVWRDALADQIRRRRRPRREAVIGENDGDISLQGDRTALSGMLVGGRRNGR